METVTVKSLTEMRAAFEQASKKGLKWAAVSNAGCPAGVWRLTFIPEPASPTLA